MVLGTAVVGWGVAFRFRFCYGGLFGSVSGFLFIWVEFLGTRVVFVVSFGFGFGRES